MQTAKELGHERLSFVTMESIGRSEREMDAIKQGGSESLSVTIVEWEKVDPLGKGVNDRETPILTGKSFALTLIIHSAAGPWAVVRARFE